MGDHALLGCSKILPHHTHHLLVRTEAGAMNLELTEGVLCGNGSHNRITRVHVRPSFGSVNIFAFGD